MAIETPEQRRQRMAQRHPDAVNSGRGGLPQMQVQELGAEEVTPAARRVNRGETGMADPQADSQMRIRQNAEARTQPTARQPELERMGLGEQSQAALERSKKFTSATGTFTQPALNAQARPRAVGGLLAAGLGASTTAMNAAQVYDQTGGDISETAKQVAYDAPAAIGSTLGAVAGGYLGRRNPSASNAGMLAGGLLGDTGGRQIAAGADRLLGGDGLSPLEALQAQQPQTATQLTPEQQAAIDEVNAISDADSAARAGAQVPQTTAPTPAASTPIVAQPALGETTQPAQAPAPVAPAPAGNGFAPTNIPGVVGRTNAQGVPEFSNDPEAVRGATGPNFTAGGRLGDGQGTFSQLGDSALAMQRYERAGEIRRQGRLDDMQARQAAEQRSTMRRMQINDTQARDLLRSGRPSEIIQARALQRENLQLGQSLEGARQSEQALGLGQQNAQILRERNEILDSGVRAQTALQRQQLAEERAANEQIRTQASGREAFAEKNAETFPDRVANLFSQVDPATGEAGVPPQTMALIEERAPVYAQQREAALRESIAALQRQAEGGDATAAAQLEQAQNDYARFRQDVYRIGADGQTAELRPVREWPEDQAAPFFTDVKDQQLRQGARTDSIVPDIGGALAGAGLGSTALRLPGGPRVKIPAFLASTAIGAIAGDAAESQGLGTRSTAPKGAQNLSATIPANFDYIAPDGDNVVATLGDGQVVNLSDLARAQADPTVARRAGDIIPKYGRGGRTSEYQDISRATFDATLAQLNSANPRARADAQNTLALFARDDALYQSLSEKQRARLPRQTGLGE